MNIKLKTCSEKWGLDVNFRKARCRIVIFFLVVESVCECKVASSPRYLGTVDTWVGRHARNHWLSAYYLLFAISSTVVR